MNSAKDLYFYSWGATLSAATGAGAIDILVTRNS